MKMKRNLNDSIRINEINSFSSTQSSKTTSTINSTSIDYTNIPDQNPYQKLFRALNGIDKLGHFLNEKEKIELVRHYISLIDRLFYVKLQQQQWNHYHHIGVTQNIWSGRMSKHIGEKNSICYTYRRSKIFIEQYHKKIQKQLQQAQDATALFEEQIFFKSTQHVDCSSEIKVLSSMINTFVYEKQQKLRDEFEYKRQMLIWDATDHRLVQAFFDSKPMKSQIISARHIWQATVKQIMIDEEIAILENRITSKQLLPASTLFDHTINNIEILLAKPNNASEQNTSANTASSQFEKINQLKHDFIDQSIITARKMAENFTQIILDEKQKYFIKTNGNQHTFELQVAVINAIENRRSHMIQSGNYIAQQQLTTY